MKKILRFGIAFLITVITLMIARRLAPVHSVDMKETIDSITIEHSTVAKIIDGKPDLVSVKITSPDSTPLFVDLFWTEAKGRLAIPGFYRPITMPPGDSGIYRAPLPILEKGKRGLYYIEVHSRDGKTAFKFPPNGEEPILIRYEGSVPPYIIIPHIFLMFVAIFLATLALFDAISVIQGVNELADMARNFKWATVTVFLGGYLFGWAMNYYAFGTFWEGIPFGWDFTDNKTQIVLLYLILLNLSMLGTMYRGRFGGNNFSDKTLGYLAVVGYILIMAIYIVPHSIQYPVAPTAVFSYGSTAIIIGLYIFGLTRRQKWTGKN